MVGEQRLRQSIEDMFEDKCIFMSVEDSQLECSSYCDLSSSYRTISGCCNNINKTYLGSANTAFDRLLDPAYEDQKGVP